MSHKAQNIAENIEYTPSVLSNWNGSTDPGKVSDGLDQLSSRTKTLEGFNNIFGSNFFLGESLGVSTHTGDTLFVSKLILNITPAVPAGTYRIGFTYHWSMSSTSQSFKAHLLLDSVIFDHVLLEPQEVDNEDIMTHFFYVTFATPATHTIEIQYGTTSAGQTATISDAKIEFWRVS